MFMRLFTHAQAYGAGRLDLLPCIFQRTVVFLCVHMALLFMPVVLLLPHLMAAIGEETDLVVLLAVFVPRMLPGLWLEVLNR